MATSTNPHDKFIKKVLSYKENSLDFFNSVLSQNIKKYIDLSTLTLDKTSYIDDDLKEYFSDVVFNCRHKGKMNAKITLLI